MAQADSRLRTAAGLPAGNQVSVKDLRAQGVTAALGLTPAQRRTPVWSYLRNSVAATWTNTPVSSAINRPRPRGSGPPFILPRLKPSSGSASMTSNGALAWASARSIGSLPADDHPPKVRVTITCKPTSAALVTHGAAF